MNKDMTLPNSTTDFLLFQSETGGDTIDVKYADKTVWLTQKMIAKLFDVEIPTISEHLKNIFDSKEIIENATIRNFLIVQNEGTREVKRKIDFYNLDAVISVGYRVNSQKAIQFRIWATQVLKEFAIKGFVLDKKRLENGAFVSENYFEELLEDIREIRASERNFYQKITDIYATSLDYNKNSEITNELFSKVQNKMHYAVHAKTAPELVMTRADAKKVNMGLNTWKNAPDGKIIQTDVSIAKNYLTQKEIKSLNRIVTMYLDFAEDQAEQNNLMTMDDWSDKLNAFLKFNNRDVLENPGKVSAEIAKEFAVSEFKKFRVLQDTSFQSDFDKLLKK